MLTVYGQRADGGGGGGSSGNVDDNEVLIATTCVSNDRAGRTTSVLRVHVQMKVLDGVCLDGRVCEGPLLQTAQGRLFWFLQLFLDLIPRRDVVAREI